MRKLLLICLAGCLLAACDNRRELVEEESIWVRVNLDWTQAGIKPGSATVWFFPRNNTCQKAVAMRTNQALDSIKLCQGSYSVIVFNESENTHDGIRFRGTDRYETFEAYAAPEGSQGNSAKADEEVLAMIPGTLAAAHPEPIEITWGMIAHDQRPTLHYAPRSMMFTLKIMMHFKRLDNVIVNESSASLSGIAGGLTLAEGRRTTEQVTHRFTLGFAEGTQRNSETGSLQSSYLCFGLPDGQISRAQGRNILKLALKLANGKIFNVERDVTNLIKPETGTELMLDLEVGTGAEGSEENPIIVIPDIKPIDPGTGSGFDVDVNEWGDKTVIDIPINQTDSSK